MKPALGIANMDPKVEYLQRLWLIGYTPFEAIHIIYKRFGLVLSGYAIAQQFLHWDGEATRLSVTQHVVKLLSKAGGVA